MVELPERGDLISVQPKNSDEFTTVFLKDKLSFLGVVVDAYPIDKDYGLELYCFNIGRVIASDTSFEIYTILSRGALNEQ